MKILHTADWHLGKRLDSISRQQEQQEVMQEICDIADQENVQVVIIAGDLFDTFNPPTESIELFYRTLKRLAKNGRRAVIAIAGNHDSPDRIEAPDPLARECGIIFAGYPNSTVTLFELESGLKLLHTEPGFIIIQIPGEIEPLRVLLTPYASEYRLKSYLGYENPEEEMRQILKAKWLDLAAKFCDNTGVNLLLCHLFVMKKGDSIPEESDDEKPILHIGGAQVIYADDIPPEIQYTALGHLHRKQITDTTNGIVAYSGSPLSYSFGEADQKKYVLIADLNSGKKTILKSVELTCGKRLLRKQAHSIDEAISWLHDNPRCLVELTMTTENFLTADERKRLFNAHTGIITLIPDVKNKGQWEQEAHQIIDLSKTMEDLFSDYFKHVKGQDPNEEILNLFKEVMAQDH